MENTCHHMLLTFFIAVMCLIWVANSKPKRDVAIGVILDMDSGIGKMSSTCITMAIHDFYQKHNDSTTVIRPHYLDSKQDNLRAASVAIDLFKNVQVAAILGPTTSSQADFVIAIGNKSNVPIISPATSPSLSPNDNLYFIRSAHASNSQLEPLAALIKHFNWREVVFVYEDDEYGRGLVPYFSHVMQNISTKLMYQTGVHPLASDDWILEELYKLKTVHTRVFVVHALPDLASRFFNKVNETGMMEEGYVWIITEVLTSRLHLLDRVNLDSMHGVLGVKSYIPRSKELTDFEKRWKREFWDRNPKDDEMELDMFGIRWYDTLYDAVVGDVTILASRWDYIDFTLPYTEGGVSLIVPFVDERKNAWIFVRPIETPLWITTVAFFIYTGFVVWVLEHRVNKEFRGPPHKQVGMIFWFSFSTLVYAHREKLISNLSRFVVIVWVLVVLVLTSSYTASLTSMLTVEQLRPTHTDIDQIRRNGESVGYQKGSFVVGILKSIGFDDAKLKSYSTFEEYDRALQAGSRKGGVSAIMDELPYIRLFLAIYCNNYTMTNATYRTAGFGFVSSFYCVLFQDFISYLLVQTSRARAQ
ncbi:putative periplasmic binding protein-like I [Helianthus annuus]|nr:putative periplasmic binding protein-like I [Helianthus annuus]KAJ0701429.1 putative periplasmic binding protein-like I [Helianthus annuus]